MIFEYDSCKYNIKRYPSTDNTSLKPWSAADEYILNFLEKEKLDLSSVAVLNDRFGFLTTVLAKHKPLSIIFYKSQEKSLLQNLENNKIDKANIQFCYPLSNIDSKIELTLLKIPKSLELFELMVSQLHASMSEDAMMVCSFMTRNFSPQMLKISEKYFENIEQSRAWKKSRLLILKTPKKLVPGSMINELEYKDKLFKQYYGVFSGNNVDFASRFLIDNLKIKPDDKVILDLASGNGVIAHFVRQEAPKAVLHLVDDAFLAVESSKLNIDNANFHFSDDLEIFADDFFDLVVTNPPFHFEYENNIEVSLRLFKEVYRCLKPRGRLMIVANKHINYKTHLQNIFQHIEVVDETTKFIIYTCTK